MQSIFCLAARCFLTFLARSCLIIPLPTGTVSFPSRLSTEMIQVELFCLLVGPEVCFLQLCTPCQCCSRSSLKLSSELTSLKCPFCNYLSKGPTFPGLPWCFVMGTNHQSVGHSRKTFQHLRARQTCAVMDMGRSGSELVLLLTHLNTNP